MLTKCDYVNTALSYRSTGRPKKRNSWTTSIKTV